MAKFDYTQLSERERDLHNNRGAMLIALPYLLPLIEKESKGMLKQMMSRVKTAGSDLTYEAAYLAALHDLKNKLIRDQQELERLEERLNDTN